VRPDPATDVACGDGERVAGLGGRFPAQTRLVQTQLAGVFGEVEVHVVELGWFAVCHSRAIWAVFVDANCSMHYVG
jgi:hypothetical protein